MRRIIKTVHKLQGADFSPQLFEDTGDAARAYILLSHEGEGVSLTKVTVKVDRVTGEMKEI